MQTTMAQKMSKNQTRDMVFLSSCGCAFILCHFIYFLLKIKDTFYLKFGSYLFFLCGCIYFLLKINVKDDVLQNDMYVLKQKNMALEKKMKILEMKIMYHQEQLSSIITKKPHELPLNIIPFQNQN